MTTLRDAAPDSDLSSLPTTASSVTLHPAYTIAPIPRRAFGSFVEHMGRCVYTGIYRARPPHADADGFRTDVLDLVRELGVTRRPLPGRQLRLRLSLGGRGRAARSTADAARPGLAHDRDQPVRHRRVHRLVPEGRRRADAGGQPRHPRGRGGARRFSSTATSRRHRPLGPALAQRLRRAARHQAVVPGQRDGRPVADRPQDRRRVRPARSRDRRAMRQVDPSIELVACGVRTGRCRRSATWEATSSSTPTTTSTTSRCTPTTNEGDGDLAASSLWRRDMDRFIEARRRDRGSRRARACAATSGSTSRSTSGTVWYQTDWPAIWTLP